MKSNEIKNKVEGGLKEVANDIAQDAKNAKLKVEGLAEHAEGKAKEAAADVKNAAHEVVEHVKDAVEKHPAR